MIYIEPAQQDAAYHFAAEEYVTQSFPQHDIVWMLWRNKPCVMLGQNQVADAEVNLREARRLGVAVTRRASGGGTIYTDEGTLQFTRIAPFSLGAGSVEREREALSEPLLYALRQIGANAKLDGRNDITLDGAKVSGMAQYYTRGRACSHASLLYSANLDALARVLRPDEDKIKAKALRSVRARVRNVADTRSATPLSGFLPILINVIKEYGAAEHVLTPADHAAIERVRAEKYASDAWTYGKSPAFSFRSAKRFPQGNLDVSLDVAQGVIKNCVICGDFLGVLPTASLETRLVGVPYILADVRACLAGMDLRPYLGGIAADEFVSVMFSG
ncbi:MAG: lipoate--protein ligase [Oscillospiraceae bacterium]|jgi:lipoate-protein ligase A|nr:lipoate--protein ligase [Oscillospiraceae bacterium]